MGTGRQGGCYRVAGPPKPNTPDTVLSTSLPDSPLGALACTCVAFHHALAIRAIALPDAPPECVSLHLCLPLIMPLLSEPCLSIAA